MSEIRGLIIKEKWLDRMFQNKKLWEIRNFGTKIRGKIYLIQSGSKQIVGECHIVNCIKLDEETFETNRNIHTIEKHFSELEYNHPYAWVIGKGSARRYETPIPYNHPSGAIVWVGLEGKCDLNFLLEQSKLVSYTS